MNLYGEETTEETDTRDRDDELTYSDANGSEYVRYGGRVDMCFLFVFNKKTGKLDVIDINRDSMTDVDICTTKGEVALTDTMQVGLAYGYADGGTKAVRISQRRFQRCSTIFRSMVISHLIWKGLRISKTR